jgi:hypothetical protein
MAIKGKISSGPKPQMPSAPQVNVDFMKIWQTVDQYIPPILKDPIKLGSKTLKYTNLLFTYLSCDAVSSSSYCCSAKQSTFSTAVKGSISTFDTS